MSVKSVPKKGYKSVPWLFQKEIEIPEEWELEPLEKFSNITMGMSPPSESYNENQEGLPFYQGVTDFGENYPNTTMWCSDPKKIAEKDQILFSVRAPVGETNITNEPSCLGRGVCSISPLDNELMYCYFLISYFKKQFLIYAQGTTYDAINKNEIARTKLPFTSNKNEQQQIASILSNVDNLIQNTDKLIEKTTRLKKGLMQELLVKGIGHTKFKKVPWLFGKEIEIPEEWEITVLKNVCSIREDSAIESNLYVGLEHIAQHNNTLIDRGNLSEFTSNKNSFRKDDVLYGKLRPLLNKVWLATEDGFCSTDILPLQVNNKILPLILLLILTHSRFYWFAVSTSAGTKMPRTNWTDMQEFTVLLPPLPEQQQIASILSNTDEKIQSYKRYKEKLQRLKTSLMQKLLTGEVRVAV